METGSWGSGQGKKNYVVVSSNKKAAATVRQLICEEWLLQGFCVDANK